MSGQKQIPLSPLKVVVVPCKNQGTMRFHFNACPWVLGHGDALAVLRALEAIQTLSWDRLSVRIKIQRRNFLDWKTGECCAPGASGEPRGARLGRRAHRDGAVHMCRRWVGASGVSWLGSGARVAVVAVSPQPPFSLPASGGCRKPSSPVLRGCGSCQTERTRSLCRGDAGGQISVLERHYCVFGQDSKGVTHCRLI